MPVLSRNAVPEPPPPQTTRQRLVAILLVCGAVLGFTVIDVSAKYLARDIGAVQTTFLRYLSGFVWILPFLNPFRVPGLLKSERPWLQFLRAALLLASTALNFVAIQYLQLAQTVSIMFLAPLIVSLMAGPLLGEWAGPRRLAAIAVGFVGVLIITRPGTGAIHPAALLTLMGMLCYATILLMTRRLSARDSAETTMFYSSLFGAVALLPIAALQWKAMPGLWHWTIVVIMGFGGAAGHWLLIQAQRFTDAPVLAPFLYTQIVWMALGGYVFYGEMPDRWTFIGSSVVICSGLYLLHRERIRALEMRKKTENR
jgi:drug/metabolite transporter (DMT)-like permease